MHFPYRNPVDIDNYSDPLIRSALRILADTLTEPVTDTDREAVCVALKKLRYGHHRGKTGYSGLLKTKDLVTFFGDCWGMPQDDGVVDEAGSLEMFYLTGLPGNHRELMEYVILELGEEPDVDTEDYRPGALLADLARQTARLTRAKAVQDKAELYQFVFGDKYGEDL